VKRPAPIFRGDISHEGAFRLADAERSARQTYFRTLAGKRVDIIVREHRAARSEQANAYYWSCVLTPISESTSAGDQAPEEIHDAMCAMFLPDEKKRVEFINRFTGESIEVEVDGKRSSKLKGDEFYRFVEQVRKFALETLGVHTEDPDPHYWRKQRRAA
jgi:hypothetical protein